MNEPTGDVNALTGEVKASWQRFLDVFEPIRPELYRYCRYLTKSAWDAEDLAQDSMARAFVTLGTVFNDVSNPRAWLFRVASNLWVDRTRRLRHERALEPPGGADTAEDPRKTREAAGTLLAQLAPQERAAVVLKDVFDFSLDEIANVLSTSVGAVKTALHRGRGKLSEPADPVPRDVDVGVLDAFCSAFNDRDLDRMTSLLLESATVEIVGVVTEYGKDQPKDPNTGSFVGSLSPISFGESGGVHPSLLEGYLGTVPRCEVRSHRGAPILVFWCDHDFGPAIRSVMTLETQDGSIARIRNYFFTPDVIAEVCAELGLPYRMNGYRYW